MNSKRSWRAAVLLVGAAFALAPARPADAALLVLTERDRSEAIRVGKRSVLAEEFGGEWKVTGVGGQSVVVMTAFHRLALAARNSAFQNRALKPRDIDSLLKAHDGKLIFWATLRGGKADFARFYAPVLLVQQEEIRHVHPERAHRESGRRRPLYGALHVRVPQRGAQFQRQGAAGRAGPRRAAGGAIHGGSLGHAVKPGGR